MLPPQLAVKNWFSTELFLFNCFVCQSLVPNVLFSNLHIFCVAGTYTTFDALYNVLQSTTFEMTWNGISLPVAAAMLFLT